MKKRAYILILFFACSTWISAAEPVLDLKHPLNSTGWFWHIDSQYTDTLKLYQGRSIKPAGQYDLTGCMFCSGEDDGCEQDGIFAISLQQDLNEPIVAAVCHIGAHSRMLQIFAPHRDRQDAVHTVTGDFIIDYDIDPQGITVKYDRRNEVGEFMQKLSRWPQPLDAGDK